MNKLVKRLTGILAAGLMLMARGLGGRPQEPEQSTPETTSAPVVLPEASVLYAAALEKIEAEKSVGVQPGNGDDPILGGHHHYRSG